MAGTVELPVWLLVLIAAFAAWAALDRLLMPSVRWYFRRKIRAAIADARTRLQIDLPDFALTKRQVLIDRLMFDPQVQAAAAEQARETGAPRDVVMQQVGRYAREIVPAFNAYFYFRLGYRMSRALSRLFYRVRLGRADDESLRAIGDRATPVFIINHRSNMDYVLVAFLAAERTALSYAVGEWARVWPLQSLIKLMGGFFVRRGSGDPLYRKVLERYVAMATEGGLPQAIFPEGRLSRDGAIGEPRIGLIDYILRGFDQHKGRDVAFIPVGINYDRVVEDRSLVRNLDPEAPPRSRSYATMVIARFLCRQLWLALRGRWHKFGYAVVDFGTPISLRDWLARRELRLEALDREARIVQVKALAGDLLAEVRGLIPVPPVSLVAAALCGLGDETLKEADVEAAARNMIARLESEGIYVHLPRSDPGRAVAAGLRVLRRRGVIEDREDGTLIVPAGDRTLLQYYANAVATPAQTCGSGPAGA